MCIKQIYNWNHDWNHVPTLSLSSSHTWQTYLSPKPLFHLNSNWHLSRPCWENQVYQNRISQISNQYQICILLAKFSSFLPLHVFHSRFKISQFLSFTICLSQISFYRDSLLKLTNDIMETIDSWKITILTALDMSATFDTLDHITHFHRLQHTVGLYGLSRGFVHI